MKNECACGILRWRRYDTKHLPSPNRLASHGLSSSRFNFAAHQCAGPGQQELALVTGGQCHEPAKQPGTGQPRLPAAPCTEHLPAISDHITAGIAIFWSCESPKNDNLLYQSRYFSVIRENAVTRCAEIGETNRCVQVQSSANHVWHAPGLGWIRGLAPPLCSGSAGRPRPGAP